MSGGGGNETRVYQVYRDNNMKVEEQGGGRGKARV